MKFENLRAIVLAALAVMAFQGSSAREAIAKPAEYDAAVERAYEWSKQMHAPEERAMRDLTLEARDLLRHPPEVAGPTTPARPDADVVARSAPGSLSPEATGPTRSSDWRPWLAWLEPNWGSRPARVPSEPTVEVAEATAPPGAEPSLPKAIQATAEDPPAPSRVAGWWKQIRALRSGEPEPGGKFAEESTPATETEERGVGTRLWAWLNEEPSPGADVGEISAPTDGGESAWPGSRLWAWLTQPSPEVELDESVERAAEEEGSWPGARLWGRLAALFGGSDAPYSAGPTRVAAVEAPRAPEPVAPPSAELAREPEPVTPPSAEATPERFIGNEVAERNPAHDSSTNGTTAKIGAERVRSPQLAPRGPIAQARADPPEPPARLTTAKKRAPATAARPSAPSAAGRGEPAIPSLRSVEREFAAEDPSPPTAEPTRAAKRKLVSSAETARQAKATPAAAQVPRARVPAEPERRPAAAARRTSAPKPAPRRAQSADAPTAVARSAPPPPPPVRVAEPPARVPSRAKARDSRVARAEPRPHEERHAPRPRTAVGLPPRTPFPPPLPEPTEHWRRRGRELARQELARVQAALRRDGRPTQEIDPLRVAIEMLRTEERQAHASAERR